ncbi:MAG: ABC transporter permease [Muribaculaceae bacterium]|nr:ABC transporter permease [Muribaculaceae bacterium]
MNLPSRIAYRYLRAPKAHSAVNAISIISVVGVAVATAAIVCVLSVFNGFHSLLADRLDTLSPDILITPGEGKVFSNADSIADIVRSENGVETVMPSIVDNALVIYNSREMPVTLRGVSLDQYSRITSLDSLLIDKDSSLAKSQNDDEGDTRGIISIGTASQLSIGETGEQLLIFAPRREGRVNLANPMASFITDSISVAGIFQAYQSDYDEKTVICDIGVARDLFQYDNEATSLEVKLKSGSDTQQIARALNAKLGNNAVVKDRLQQQEMNFRMISIEKWVTFLLLIFILIIASFNIISTLCMIVLEKQPSLSTLSALGMKRGSIAAVFRWESVYVSLIGGIAGILLGLGLCLLQQHFGLIRLAGDPERMIVSAYPVMVKATDVLLVLIPVAATGLVTAAIAGGFARTRIA